MDTGRRLLQLWTSGRTRSCVLPSLRQLADQRLFVSAEAIAGAGHDVDEGLVSATRREPGMSPARSFCGTRRNFYSDGGERKKKKLMPLQERKMIDKFRLHVRGGDGGAGCSSFRKGVQSRNSIADGGNGGRGGDVILVSSAAVWDLSNLQHHLNGAVGGQGSSKKKVGSRGKDKIVQVPVGTVIHLVRGSIPSLEPILHSQEEPTWEEWEGVHLKREDDSLCEQPQSIKSECSIEREVEPTEFISSPNVRRGEGKSPSPRSRCDSKTLVECGDPGDRGFREASELDSVGQLPFPSSGKDLGISSEESEDYDSDDNSGKEDEDHSWEQAVQSSVAEFVKVGQTLIVACGGAGGKGNAAMARGRGAAKVLPSFEHELGEPGSKADLILELKTIADVGLVGAPNAGKSSLLGSLSMAKPISGHYKFTTLRPNIGVVEFEDWFSLTVADIPGLIEGAHQNRGLGHAFLRHIERTKVLAYVLDLAGGFGDDTGLLPWDQFEELVFELEQYQKGLSQRPSIIVANKLDEEGALEALEMLRQRFPYLEIYAVCAVLNEGTEELKVALRRLVESSETNSPSLLPLSELVNG